MTDLPELTMRDRYIVCKQPHKTFSYPTTKHKREIIRRCEAEPKLREASILYRTFLECLGNPQLDMVDDLRLDIKDGLKYIDRILAGEKPKDIFRCDECPSDVWQCKLCEALSSEAD